MFKKNPLSESSVKIIQLFLLWKFILLVTLFLSIKFIPLGVTDKFLGGGTNFHIAPHLFSWANFDGEHYLSIAIFGYKDLEQAFFPVYPLLMSFFAHLFGGDYLQRLINSTIVGLVISNTSILVSLFYLYKLINIDFPKKIAFFAILLLLFFPTSFYFGAVYSESLFLLTTVLAFLNARRGNWFLASIFGMISSATRVFGIILLPAFLIEAYLQKKYKNLFWVILIPLGLVSYMYYQFVTVGDPLAFYNVQPLVGEQRQSQLVLLPQVFYRYLKMLTSVSWTTPIYQTVLLEFIVGIVFLILPIFGFFKKVRISYLFYAFVGFLVTTAQGSFSSVPRYVLVFFPSFIALALWIDNRKRIYKFLFFILSLILLIIESGLFLRGYWVA